MKSLLFIINPCSGKGQIRSHLLNIINIFNCSGYTVTVHVTQCRLDAEQKVFEDGSLYDFIVCSGGDGTLNEVVSGMLKSGLRKTIGYIPAGSTNDFASSLNIPKNMKKAAELIVNNSPFSCDVGSFNDRYFNYVAAFGAFTEVSYATSQQMKNMLGHPAYLIEGIKSLTSIKSSYMKFQFHDQIVEGEFIFGMITNATSVGGFRTLIGGTVDMDDGEFELTLIRTPKNPLAMQEILISILVEEASSEYLITCKVNELVIESPEEVPWVLDGEFGGNPQNIIIKNHKHAIDIICNKKEFSMNKSIETRIE